MPSANPAVQAQPTITMRAPGRRFALHAVGVLIGLALLVPAATIAAPSVVGRASPNNCAGWNSTTRPPDRIRVLRVKSGRIDSVPFKEYVTTVLGKEWPGYLPLAVVEAGAVAVKQYAWFHALGNGRRTSDGRCFDVRDSTGDQLYKPGKARVRMDHHRAVEATWAVTLFKDGRLFMTGYRRGNKGNCGRDATGWKLYARSATRCANRGYDFRRILRTYYGPNLRINESGSGANAQPASQPALEPALEPAAVQSADPSISDRLGPDIETSLAPRREESIRSLLTG